MVIYAVYGSLDLTGLIDELILNDGISPLYSTHRMRLKVNKKAHKREFRKRVYPQIELLTAGGTVHYQPFYLFAPEQMETPLIYPKANLSIAPRTTYSMTVAKVSQTHISLDNVNIAIERFAGIMAGGIGLAAAQAAANLDRFRAFYMPRRVELDEITPETPHEQYPEWLQSVAHRYTVGVDVGIEGHDYTVFQEGTLIEGDGGDDGDRA